MPITTYAHGKGTRVYADGYDVSSYLNSSNTPSNREEFDTSTYGATADKDFQAGDWDGTVDIAGFWKNDMLSVPANPVADRLLAATLIIVAPAGVAAVGAPARVASVFNTKFENPSTATDIIPLSASYRADDGVAVGKLLKIPGVVAASGNGPSVDFAVQSKGRWATGVALIALDAGSVVAAQQHSADNTTWVTAATSAALTATGQKAYLAGTGTLERYRRIIYTLAGGATAANFVAAHGSR